MTLRYASTNYYTLIVNQSDSTLEMNQCESDNYTQQVQTAQVFTASSWIVLTFT